MNFDCLKNQFEDIHRKLDGNHLNCHFTPFNPPGVTWEKRVELRKILVKELESFPSPLPQEERKVLLTPGGPPRASHIAISLSHCPSLGGFIFSLDKNISLGLDIEKVERVGKTVERLSDHQEVVEAPNNALLWAAKESALKSVPLEKKQRLLSDIHIFRWETLSTEIYSFHFQITKRNIQGLGGAFIMESTAFAYAKINLRKES